MAITTYTELQTAVANWLNRGDLTSRIPEFIALAEADIRRNLNPIDVLVGSTLDAGADFWTPNPGFLKSISMNTDSYKYPITFLTPAALAEVKRVGSGVPVYAAVVNGVVFFDVEVDSAYDVNVVYGPDLIPLSASVATNIVLNSSSKSNPDIYLYGALKEAAPYLEHDERNPMWAAKYQKAVDDENKARESAVLGMGPVAPRLPIIFG